METNFSSIGFNKDTKSDDISLMSLKCSVVLALKRSSVSPSSGSTSFSSSWLSLGNKNHSFRRALLEIFSLLLSPYHVFFYRLTLSAVYSFTEDDDLLHLF